MSLIIKISPDLICSPDDGFALDPMKLMLYCHDHGISRINHIWKEYNGKKFEWQADIN